VVPKGKGCADDARPPFISRISGSLHNDLIAEYPWRVASDARTIDQETASTLVPLLRNGDDIHSRLRMGLDYPSWNEIRTGSLSAKRSRL
jgi:hypothetical protein